MRDRYIQILVWLAFLLPPWNLFWWAIGFLLLCGTFIARGRKLV